MPARFERLTALFDGCPARNFLHTGQLTRDKYLSNIVTRLENYDDVRVEWVVTSGTSITVSAQADDNVYSVTLSWPSTWRSPLEAQACVDLYAEVVKFAVQMQLVLNSK